MIPEVLIVDNGCGEVFIVENKKSKSQVDKILSKNKPKHQKPSTPTGINFKALTPATIK
jgi:hypothetical protein